jgi:HEAT repeat protein
MNNSSTIAPRLLFAGSLALLTAGCNGQDPAPKRVISSEPSPAQAQAAAEYDTGASLFGGPLGARIVPRPKTLEQTAVDALARIGSPSVPALVTMLRDPDAELRQDAARALAKMGTDASRALPELIVALEDKDEEVRKEAARALGEIGPAASDAIPALVDTLRSSAKQAEQEAAAAKARQP